MTTQLTKPHFVKVKDLENARSGYNVYVKVVSVEKSETQTHVPIVRAVVADQTGSANAFFKGENAALIEEGKVIAIRNGTINFIKSKISLEVDIFGRITPETVEIKQTNTTNNVSEKEVERKPRRNEPRREGEERQPRREGDERRPRREGEERRPRREGEERRPRREGEERPPRREGERQPRREGEERQPRREGEERRPRREGEERAPRREGEYKPRREGEERQPRREGDFDRRPRREGEERRPRREGEERAPRREGEERAPRRDENRGDRRPPVKFTKISAVEPGDESLNFFAKILSVEQVGKKARVVLGDETAIIRAFLFADAHIQVGESVVLFGAEARVVKEHIEIQVPREGKVDRARREVKEVNESFDISAKEWVEANQ